jgi:hypothetical protein
VEGDALPMLKPKFAPPLENNLEVGMEVEGMGVCMLGILTDGFDDTDDVPHMEEPKTKGMDGEGPMELRGGNEDMTEMPPDEFPPIPLEDGLMGSTALDEALGPDMVGG